MATDSSHRVIMEKTVLPLFLNCFSSDLFLYLQVTMTCTGARRRSKFSQIRPPTAELVALERMKKSHRLIMGKYSFATFSRLFLIESILYLLVTMTYMRAWMSLKFCQIRLLVSIATDRVIMEKTVLPLFLCFFFLSDPFHTYR